MIRPASIFGLDNDDSPVTDRPDCQYRTVDYNPPDQVLQSAAVTSHIVYILKCADSTLYTGYTTDIDRRVTEHNNETAAKYTKGRTPVTLVHVEYHDSKSTALQREYEIKQLDRSEKEALCNRI